jgi:RNA polymerase sigma-70 factor (ECF subfamily)
MTATLALAVSDERAGEWFDALYRASAADIYAYVATLLRDRSAAEDVTALAFERAFRRRRLFNPRRGSERAWLFGIARNAALDELRRRKRIVALNVDVADIDALHVAEEAEQAALRATVRVGLAQLAPRDRELILLKFHGQLSNAELARVIGTTESNAGTRLHRAVRRLREVCDEAA